MIGAIRAALIEGEESGISDRTPQEVREAVKKRLRKNGQLPPQRLQITLDLLLHRA
jgi:hypothetical protein